MANWPPPQEADDTRLKDLALTVDYYAVDVDDAGDCGIYFLIEHPPPGTVDKPFIHRAVLIDGGYGAGRTRGRSAHGNGAECIREFLRNRVGGINGLYHFDSNQGGRTIPLSFPAFDSIVITHWDGDHYRGVMTLINDEVIGTYQSYPAATRDAQMQNYLCPYMKYNPVPGANQPRGVRAKTVIFVPYWGNPEISRGRNFKFPTDEWFDPRNFRPTRQAWSAPTARNPNATTSKIPMYFDPTEFLDWRVVKLVAGDRYVSRLCRIGAGIGKFLGVNLFSPNSRPADLNAALAIPTPQALAQFHNQDNENAPSSWPVLAIVAGMSSEPGTRGVWTPKCVGDAAPGRNPLLEMQNLQTNLFPQATSIITDAEPSNELESEIVNSPRFRPRSSRMATVASKNSNSQASETQPLQQECRSLPIRIIDKPLAATVPKYTNAASLITMVIWTTGQISCFAGGDTNWQNELRCVAWVQKNPSFTSVRTVKIQHHGAADSTPYELIRCFRPRNLVIMANAKTGKTRGYNHPRWEVLLWLYLWFRITRDNRIVISANNQPDTRPWIKATAFPSYLTTLSGARFKWDSGSVDALETWDVPARYPETEYLNSLKNLATILGDNTSDYKAEFDARNTEKRKRLYVGDSVLTAWPYLGNTTNRNATSIAIHSLSRSVPITNYDRVQFIKSYCRPVDSTLRQNADGFMDGYALTVFARDSNAAVIARSSIALPPLPPPPTAPPLVVVPRVVNMELEEKDSVSASVAMDDARSSSVQQYGSSIGAPSPNSLRSVLGTNVWAMDVENNQDDLFMPPPPGLHNPTPPPTLLMRADADPSTSMFLMVPDFAVAQIQAVSAKGSTQPPTLVIYQIPSTASNFDSFSVFVALLDKPAIQLSTLATGPGASSSSLYSNDVLRQWLILAGRGDPDAEEADVTIQYQLSSSGSTQLANIQGLTLILPQTASQPKILFSTSSVLDNLSSRYPKAIPVPPSGYFPTHSFLALGVTKDYIGSNAPWKLSEVFMQVNIDTTLSTSQGAVLSALLDAFQNNFNFQLFLEKGMIWFAPTIDQVVQRMEWALEDSAATKLTNWCHDWLKWDIDIYNIRFVSQRQCRREVLQNEWEMSYDHELLFTFQMVRKKDTTAGADSSTDPAPNLIITTGLDLKLSQGSASLTVTINIDPGSAAANDGLLDFLEWLVPEVDFSALNTIIPGITDAVNKIKVRSIEVTILKTASGMSVDGIIIMAEYSNDSWQVLDTDGTTKVVVPLLMTYGWRRGLDQPHSVDIRVWFVPTVLQHLPPQILPEYEDIYFIQPSKPAPSALKLDTLLPNGGFKLPTELQDLEITELSLSLEDTTISITGTIQRDPNSTSPPANSLGIALEEVALSASYTWASKTDSTPHPDSYEIELEFDFSVGRDPNLAAEGISDDDEEENSSITGSALLISVGGQKQFQLTGAVDSVTLGQLIPFFPDGDSDLVKSILGHIYIVTLNLEYNYDQIGAASDFSINATLILDVLDLNLSFTRDQQGWKFDATLTPDQNDSADLSIDGILKAVLGDNSSHLDSVPDFVKQITLDGAAVHLSMRSHNPQTPDPSSTKSSKAASDGTDTDAGSFIVCLALDIPGPDNTTLELAFYQITEKAPPGSKTDVESSTKRLVKVTLDGLPWDKIPKVPVIDNMKPAFDELGFYWVSDPTWKGPDGSPGLNRTEVEKLSELSPIVFKDPSKSTGNTPDPKAAKVVVIDAGWHFMVIDSGGGQGDSKAILDYLFKPKPPSTSKIATVPGDGGDSDDDTPGTEKGALQKTVGPFTIENVGVRYQDSALTLYFDILAHLGPIELDLLGLGITVHLDKSSLQSMVLQVPDFTIQGMGVQYNEPPVGITGLFVEKQIDANSKIYVGGINLVMDPYSFIAVGGYGDVMPVGSSSSFKTMFFFAKLEGPLIELEFVTVGGICLGFGYNSRVSYPTVDQVASYPFIDNSGLGGDNPLAIMEKLTGGGSSTGIISPQDSCYWLVAGLEAKFLQMLDITAVIILEFNPYVSIGIFAKAIGSMPPETPRAECFLYVELGIAATIDFHAGTTCIEGQLSPNSFINSPDCHLTGGFAICNWFSPSEHAGDFVYTMGGYHAAYRPPAHYPTPQRLGISWQIDFNTHVTGEAYFAITPKACMAGGKLQLNYDAGLLHAWLTAWADAIIEYHPFAMLINIGLEVGVGFTLELLFISIDISVSISADLTIWASPFGGNVYVDFWVFGFSIGFGAGQNDAKALTMPEFYALLTDVPDTDAPTASGSSPTVDKLHVLSVEAGMYIDTAKDPESKQSSIWQVKTAGFIFRVQTRVALQTITAPGNDPEIVKGPDTPFYARPMQLQDQLTSTMKVVVEREDEPGEALSFTIDSNSRVLKQVPLALWGRVSDNIDPFNTKTSGTVELMMGASLHAPPPQIAPDTLVAVNVLESLALDVFTDTDRPGDGDEHPQLPTSVTSQSVEWNSDQPVRGEQQWKNVLAAWETPKIVIPATEDTPAENVVDVAMGMLGDAFGWKTVPLDESDPSVNQLQNDLTADAGALVWDLTTFEQLYLTAPLISVV